jgi:hypothetical protein
MDEFCRLATVDLFKGRLFVSDMSQCRTQMLIPIVSRKTLHSRLRHDDDRGGSSLGGSPLAPRA